MDPTGALTIYDLQHPPKFRRIPDDRTHAYGVDYGYVDTTGRAVLGDNGNGFGSARNSGRWAVVVDGKWVANLDTLREAKSRASRELGFL